MFHRLLVIDDDDRLADMLASYLRGRGFHVDRKPGGLSGLEAARSGGYDAVVLDVMLPDLEGFEVLKLLRQTDDVPVVMLTARGEAMDRVVGLELGADDYLPKPFEPRELVARLNAVLRRARRTPSEVQRFGRLTIDMGRREARLDEARCHLTSHQFSLLAALAERAGRVMTREALMEAVRGEELEAFDRSIDVHVSRIRAAIEDDPKQPRRILTVRGVGYVFASEQP